MAASVEGAKRRRYWIAHEAGQAGPGFLQRQIEVALCFATSAHVQSDISGHAAAPMARVDPVADLSLPSLFLLGRPPTCPYGGRERTVAICWRIFVEFRPPIR